MSQIKKLKMGKCYISMNIVAWEGMSWECIGGVACNRKEYFE